MFTVRFLARVVEIGDEVVKLMGLRKDSSGSFPVHEVPRKETDRYNTAVGSHFIVRLTVWPEFNTSRYELSIQMGCCYVPSGKFRFYQVGDTVQLQVHLSVLDVWLPFNELPPAMQELFGYIECMVSLDGQASENTTELKLADVA